MSHVRQRRWLFVSIATAGVVASGLLVGALASAAEPSAPTVTFNVRGAPPIACGSRPDVSSLSVPEGTEIVVANRTEVAASVQVGGETVLSVVHGEGASLSLAPGQHDIRLVPQCGVVTRTVAVTVLVTGDVEPPDQPLTDPPAPTTGATAPPTTSTTQTTPAAPEASGPPGPSAATSRPGGRPRDGAQSATTGGPALVPAATSVDPAGRPATSRGTYAGPVPGVISAGPVALEPQDHPKGLRLLAAVATICVLGVTAAIIRAIVRLSP